MSSYSSGRRAPSCICLCSLLQTFIGCSSLFLSMASSSYKRTSGFTKMVKLGFASSFSSSGLLSRPVQSGLSSDFCYSFYILVSASSLSFIFLKSWGLPGWLKLMETIQFCHPGPPCAHGCDHHCSFFRIFSTSRPMILHVLISSDIIFLVLIKVGILNRFVLTPLFSLIHPLMWF